MKNESRKSSMPGDADVKEHGLEDVPLLVVPHLMRQDGQQFRDGMPGDQGVEQDQPPEPAEAGEEGVALAGAAGAVHDEYPPHRESLGPRVGLDGGPQFARGQGRELVEERHDEHGRGKGQQELHGRDGAPAVKPGRAPIRPKNQRIPAKRGAPKTAARSQVFRMSSTKVRGVVLLKPYLSSITNVS